MTHFRRSIGVFLVCTGLAVGAIFGGNLIHMVQYARAEQQVQTSRENLAKAEDLSTVFRETSKVVEPSVVNIVVRKSVKGTRNHLPFDDETLKKFFPNMQPGDPDSEGNNDEPPMFEQMGQGSGVIVDVDGKTGYLITNNHVAGGADELTVILSDGRQIENAKVVGTDPKSDIAVVKIEADGLIAAKWGDSNNVQKGDWVMAFGSPFGYVGSMTHGIVSALNRDRVGILSSPFAQENFIQVDAPINPGNSGGPLVNVRGEIIGINTAIASRTGGFQGIGFAIPSNQAQKIAKILREKGKITRGFLGVAIASAGDPRVKDEVENFGYTKTQGVFIQDLLDDSPAQGALKRGDIVEEINGKPVKNDSDLRSAISATPPGSEVEMKVFRDGKQQDVKVKLGEQPDEIASARGFSSSSSPGEKESDAVASLGLELRDLTDTMAREFGFKDDVKGAVVTKVKRGTPAARKLRIGDVITEVGDKTVTSAREAREEIKKADLSKGVRLTVAGPDGSRFAVLKTK